MSIWGDWIIFASNVPIYLKIPASKRIGPHNIDILSIIIGSLLGDGHAEKKSNNTRITFQQKAKHLQYGLWLHQFINKLGYCNSNIPEINTRLDKKGQIRKIIRFKTWTYSNLNWIHDLFYLNTIKRVPSNIQFWLTPLALAIWIMDDGTKSSLGLKLCTNSFSYEDCLILVNALHTNFKLKSTIQSAGKSNQYVIYILKDSIPHLLEIINPYLIPSMKYKLI